MLTSSGGRLDLLMVAHATPLASVDPAATGWYYDVCPRPPGGVLVCPPNPTANPYAGVRLQLSAGDSLKFTLVNHLPPIIDSSHAGDPGMDYLALNPINIHTHGLLVSPRFPTANDPTYGDNIFVMTLNPANGPLPPDAMSHGDVRYGSTDYRIDLPPSHPSGLFWYHPHVHGIALNQVSAGMGGLITVGAVTDYVCSDSSCVKFVDGLRVRHMLLRDAQILADHTLMDELEPSFCTFRPSSKDPPRNGHCPGVNRTGSGAGDYRGGSWYFSINGQVYPNVTIAPQGEVWRITNASASASYALDVVLPSENRLLTMQLLAVDGIAVGAPGQTSAALTDGADGARFETASCPPAVGAIQPLCVSKLIMMPSSRAEIYVAYRDASGQLATPPPGMTAVFRTEGRNTGPGGDSWPQVNLASADFSQYAPQRNALTTLSVRALPRNMQQLATELGAANHAVGTEAGCVALAPGHMRRIFFNVPTGNPDAFGLGYEELDANGNPVPGTFQDVTPFDPDVPTVCVPLGPGNAAVTERWQLVNLASEDHNFHIHQTKFALLGKDTITGGLVPMSGMKIDNVPLPHAAGTCNSVQDWRNGVCHAQPRTVEIPFSIAGDFVYHCHILEHEDGGMMARIRVRPSS